MYYIKNLLFLLSQHIWRHFRHVPQSVLSSPPFSNSSAFPSPETFSSHSSVTKIEEKHCNEKLWKPENMHRWKRWKINYIWWFREKIFKIKMKKKIVLLRIRMKFDYRSLTHHRILLMYRQRFIGLKVSTTFLKYFLGKVEKV